MAIVKVTLTVMVEVTLEQADRHHEGYDTAEEATGANARDLVLTHLNDLEGAKAFFQQQDEYEAVV